MKITILMIIMLIYAVAAFREPKHIPRGPRKFPRRPF